MKRILNILFAAFIAGCPLHLRAQPSNPEDSLTLALCDNPEQIVSRRAGDFRIEYYMGETQLNMKTMRGFLELNGASAPYYKKFKARRISGSLMMASVIGFIVLDNYVSRPSFPVITLAGIATSVWGFTVFLGANDKFRLAIHHYNRDICRLK